jgi:hypothetical protein
VLARTEGNIILLDLDAADHGWFVDPTPNDNLEFQATGDAGMFIAIEDSDAAGRIDLLTTVTHELGHILGFAHDDPQADEVTLMAASLDPGVRQTLVPAASLEGPASSEDPHSGTANADRTATATRGPVFSPASGQQMEFLLGLSGVEETGPADLVLENRDGTGKPFEDDEFERFLEEKRTQRQPIIPDQLGLAQRPEWVSAFLLHGKEKEMDEALTEEITVVL